MRADRKPLKSSGQRGVIAFVAAFFAVQIAIDVAHSVTAFPFVHYGMFSESFSAPDTLLRYDVVVDGRALQAADFRIYRWDMIQGPLAAFDKQRATDDFSFDKKRFCAAFPRIYSAVSANLDNSPTLANDFPDWYRQYLMRLIGRPILSLRVYRSLYQYSDSRLILLRQTSWIDR